ncbi:hypothetical protein GGI21_005968 [Coemansia aciculifera]|uniref:Uncharacterized protein n=1 Tax=Coemansia aciculifera TaxID=417176 RepID=A0ACC1M0T6_9FUNG|nr:hypothetical protein GGI21_005968 [Coemansia aciculifera]KAJ2891928.1 hypothetical protein IWW38_003415 [Coemansia aciculifera]
MGFKKPKTRKSTSDPLDNDKIERDLDPTKVLSGGGKVAKKKGNVTSDAPKAFQHIMKFMEMKQNNDAAKRKQKEVERNKKQKASAQGPKEITEALKIMPGESMDEFTRRVRQKMTNNLQLIGTSHEKKAKAHANPSRDEGEDPDISKRSDRKKRNDAVRKQRKQAKKQRGGEDDSGDEADTSKRVAPPPPPKFGEQAQAPPIFKALPKDKFKKMVPLPQSKEEEQAKRHRDELAVKNMIQRTARLSPLERMQAKRKAKLEGDTAAGKRIIEAEREQAIRRYRMLRVARETAAAKTK